MLNFSMPELILILVIALVVFGPGKLPEVGKAIGRGINEFKGAISEDGKTKDINVKTIEASATPTEKKEEPEKKETKA